MSNDNTQRGETVLASRAPGRPPAEFVAIQQQRAMALSARGNTADAAAALSRSQAPGQFSTHARTEAIRTRRISDSAG